MGTSETEISFNDAFADVYDEFFELYNAGLEVTEISKKLFASNQEIINDPIESNNFWFALAKAKWECKQLDKELYEKVKTIIETGTDLNIWRQLDSSDKDIENRKEALEKFLLKISTERKRSKPRKKKAIRQPLYEKGDCLIFHFENGNYGGAVVLEAIRDTEFGLNLIATTRINQSKKPSIEDFEEAYVLIKSFGNWKEHPEIVWCYADSFVRGKIQIERVCKINIKVNYDTKSVSNFLIGGSDIGLKRVPTTQFEFERTKGEPQKKLTIKEIIDEK